MTFAENWLIDGLDWWPFFHFFGELDFTGTTATAFDDILFNIEVDLRLSMRESYIPEEMAEYPLPSVAYDTITGDLIGWNDGGIRETCCSGDATHVEFDYAWDFHQAVSMPKHTVDIDGQMGQVDYTPEVTAVPESATWLLISAGLLYRVRRLKRSRRQ